MTQPHSETHPITPVYHYPVRLLIAILTVLASLPMALLLTFFGSQVVLRLMPSSGDVLPISAVVIFFILSTALFMVLFTLAGGLMPFFIVMAMPACFLMIGFQISGVQWLFIAVTILAFILLSKLIHRTATPVLAICTVALTYGLYLVPALQPLFTSAAVGAASSLITVLVCWTLLSVAFGLVENAIVKPALKEQPAQNFPIDPVKGQLRRRTNRISQMNAAVSRLNEPDK